MLVPISICCGVSNDRPARLLPVHGFGETFSGPSEALAQGGWVDAEHGRGLVMAEPFDANEQEHLAIGHCQRGESSFERVMQRVAVRGGVRQRGLRGAAEPSDQREAARVEDPPAEV